MKRICVHCKRHFKSSKYHHNQNYCSNKECQKARKALWQKDKIQKDPSYRANQKDFLPGRKFESLEDLNSQAFDWATDRYAKRPPAKTKLIPLELFETEKSSLQKLPDFISSPYLQHTRLVDQYGYISFNANYYWIPENVNSRYVTVLQYANELRILNGSHEITRYKTAPDGAINMTIASIDCMLIDEVGYQQLDKTHAGLFFDLIKQRHKKKCTILTSQLGFDEWASFINDKHITAAILDRITENCTVFNMKKCISIRRKKISYAAERATDK